jgi:hypothetical protein
MLNSRGGRGQGQMPPGITEKRLKMLAYKFKKVFCLTLPQQFQAEMLWFNAFFQIPVHAISMTCMIHNKTTGHHSNWPTVDRLVSCFKAHIVNHWKMHNYTLVN